MTDSNGNAKGMILARRRVSEDKQQRVRDALDRLVRDGSALGVRSVARAAGVSHTFIHSHPHLVALVSEARETAAGARRQNTPARGGAPASALAADLALARAEITRLREENQRAKRALRHDLGARLEGQQSADLADQLERRAADLQAVIAERNLLKEQLADMRRRLTVVEEELVASQEAHLQTLREMQRPENVRTIR